MTADNLVSANVLLSDGTRAELGPTQSQRTAGAIERSARTKVAGNEPRYESIVAAAGIFGSATGRRSTIDSQRPGGTRPAIGSTICSPGRPPRPPAGWAATILPAEGCGIQPRSPDGGSEGTLAVFEDVTVNLVARPEHTALGMLSFDDLAAACDAVPSCCDSAHQPSSLSRG